MGCGSSKLAEEPSEASSPEYVSEEEQEEIVAPVGAPINQFKLDDDDKPHYIPLPIPLPGLVTIAADNLRSPTVVNTIPLGNTQPTYLRSGSREPSQSRYSNESEILYDNESRGRSTSHVSGGRSSNTGRRRRRTASKAHSFSRSHRSRPTYVALFDYKARSNQDMSFRKGDLLELLDDKDEDDWRQARHLISKATGLVPSVYIAKNGSIESKE